MKIFKILSFLICSMIVLTGCNEGSDQEETALPMDQDRSTLKIVSDSKDSFMSDYGYTFQVLFPDIKLEVMEEYRRHEDITQMLTENKPDLIAVGVEDFRTLIDDRKIISLDPFIQSDEYPIDLFVPTVIDFLKQEGHGQLYGLAPHFSSMATYINQTLFHQYGVPIPQHPFSWEELLSIADRFPASEGIYGFYEWNFLGFNPYYLFKNVTRTYRLDYTGEQAVQKLTSNPIYKEILERIVASYRKGSIYMPSKNEENVESMDQYSNNWFLKGKVATFVNSNVFLNHLQEAPSKGLPEIDWAVLPEPVDPNYPDWTYNFNIPKIYAIPVSSQNQTLAWEMIKHIHSETTTKIMTYEYESVLFTRLPYNEMKYGRDVSAFYALTPKFEEPQQKQKEDEISNTIHPSQKYTKRMHQIAKEEIIRLIDGETTSDQVLQAIGEATEKIYRRE